MAGENGEMLVKGYKLPILRWTSSGDNATTIRTESLKWIHLGFLFKKERKDYYSIFTKLCVSSFLYPSISDHLPCTAKSAKLRSRKYKFQYSCCPWLLGALPYFSEFGTFRFHRWDHTVFVIPWLVSLSIMPAGSIHVLPNDTVSFSWLNNIISSKLSQADCV